MSSSGNLGPLDQAVKAFLENYNVDTKEQFRNLAKHVRSRCEKLLESMHIKGVVQYRAKEYDSLEKKLKGLARDIEFQQWFSTEKDISKHPEMGDLAGVRIGLYFPDDVRKISERIRTHTNMKHLYGTVTGGRDATQGRNQDIQKHMNGPWHSLDHAGGDEYWHHYGYKSWQMVVEWKEPVDNGPDQPIVEIQFGTVVTQAWAEVQHNIIYKNHADIVSTQSMRRTIDAMNGLAISTEIMLKELEQSIKEEEEKRDRRRFNSGHEIVQWFESTYMSKMTPDKRQDWNCTVPHADVLLALYKGNTIEPCPNTFNAAKRQNRHLRGCL
ncbi:hypothetical protein F5Y01DRAFT_325721 [Xylaria sp. FL0043]|nr:hypothetical protein F5Y01DRAFT_325721 [Xylaria sp. FL0043]